VKEPFWTWRQVEPPMTGQGRFSFNVVPAGAQTLAAFRADARSKVPDGVQSK
jgi:hypothetical protein